MCCARVQLEFEKEAQTFHAREEQYRSSISQLQQEKYEIKVSEDHILEEYREIHRQSIVKSKMKTGALEDENRSLKETLSRLKQQLVASSPSSLPLPW